MKKNTPKTNRLALKGGAYSLIVTAVVLAILIAVNIFTSALPTPVTKFDISSGKLYSVTSNTKAVVNNLQEDVTIYWIVQADEEDTILENLLGKYDNLSSHVEVVKKNPDVFPTFAQQYTEAEVPNNSLVVESGERYRFISYTDLYEVEPDPYSYTYTVSGFDGEGAITSAIDYVVSDDLPKLYILEGHGEKDLPASFMKALEKENIEQAALSLLTVDAIPEDADTIMIYSPQRDISDKEKTMLSEYAAEGGKLLVIAGPVEEGMLTTLHSLISDYGVTVYDGILIEESRRHYAFGYPYILMPDMDSHAIVDPLREGGYNPIFPLAQGMTVNALSNATITELLYTSSDSFNKADGFALETYEREEEDENGPFCVGVTMEIGGGGEIVWFSASDFLDDMYNAYSSGANVDLTMNALSSLMGEREAISIRSKSLNYNYLTINEETSSALKLLMIGVFPLVYLGIGGIVILNKRRKQNEAV